MEAAVGSAAPHTIDAPQTMDDAVGSAAPHTIDAPQTMELPVTVEDDAPQTID